MKKTSDKKTLTNSDSNFLGIIKTISLHPEKLKEYDNKTISIINRGLNNIKTVASKEFSSLPNFDIAKECNYKLIEKMIREFKLYITDENGKFIAYVNGSYKYNPDHNTTCQICKASHNCAHVFTIRNKKTLKTLECGSQCVLKFDFPVIVDGERIKRDDVMLWLKTVEEGKEKFKKTKYSNILDLCIECNDILINQAIKEGNEIPLVGSSDYDTQMNDLTNYMYTLIQERADRKNINKNIKDAAIGIQSELYDWSTSMGRLGYTTFVPGTDLCLNNNLTVMGIFKIILMYIQANKYSNKPIDFEYIYTVAKNIKSYFGLYDHSSLGKWITKRCTKNKSDYNADPMDVLALALATPDFTTFSDLILDMQESKTNERLLINICKSVIIMANTPEDENCEYKKKLKECASQCDELIEQLKAISEEKSNKRKLARKFNRNRKGSNFQGKGVRRKKEDEHLE